VIDKNKQGPQHEEQKGDPQVKEINIDHYKSTQIFNQRYCKRKCNHHITTTTTNNSLQHQAS